MSCIRDSMIKKIWESGMYARILRISIFIMIIYKAYMFNESTSNLALMHDIIILFLVK